MKLVPQKSKLKIMDKIIISDLALRCIIGINDYERDKKQDVMIHMTLYSDTRKAAKSDNIHDTVNYKEITKEVISLVEGSSFFLLETLVDRIAWICLAYDHVEGCLIRAEKPGALRFTKKVGVEIERWKGQRR